MADTIVYTTISKGGGIDGMDHTDKGGRVTGAYLDKGKATKNPNAPWNNVVAVVVDLEEVAKDAIKAMDPVTRLAIEAHFNGIAQAQILYSR